MTIHQLPGRDRQPPRPLPPPRPRRSGQPWTTQDYEALIEKCRAGADPAELAAALERKENAVVLRAKRLLPLDQRGVPDDRVIPHLHALLKDDANYDWAHHLAATPPPRPIINRLPAPQVRTGIPGLSDEELLTFAGLVVRLGGYSTTENLREELSWEVTSRDLGEVLEHQSAREGRRWLAQFHRSAPYRGYLSEWHDWEAEQFNSEPFDPGPLDPGPFDPGPHPEHEW